MQGIAGHLEFVNIEYDENCAYDKLEFTSGDGQALGTFCANESLSENIPSGSVYSFSNQMFVNFTSDGTITGTGFAAIFTKFPIGSGNCSTVTTLPPTTTLPPATTALPGNQYIDATNVYFKRNFTQTHCSHFLCHSVPSLSKIASIELTHINLIPY